MDRDPGSFDLSKATIESVEVEGAPASGLPSQKPSSDEECAARRADATSLEDDPEAPSSPGEREVREAQAEDRALATVFEDVRRQSARGELVMPGRWTKLGFAPEHMEPQDFEAFVQDFIVAYQDHGEGTPVERPSSRTATRGVGIPHLSASRKGEEEGDGCDSPSDSGDGEASSQLVPHADPALVSSPDSDGEDADYSDIVLPAGYRLTRIEGEMQMVPIEDDIDGGGEVLDAVEGEGEDEAGIRGSADAGDDGDVLALSCDDIAVLQGVGGAYLYSRTHMTDTYAHWSFLAKEDNDITTFVETVREESRVYPRPMPVVSLCNAPFRFDVNRITAAWEVVRESGDYPDIETLTASNGDVYYFSTDSLSRVHAQSLAEWASVERFLSV